MIKQQELDFEKEPAEAEPEADGGGAAGVGGGRKGGGHGGEPLKRLIDDNFLRYASYVIRDRAIPDLDDGLKPVQRRILHSLHENDDGRFTKVANIAGYCMQYHPHGDASIQDALVTLANKDYLIEKQGNFGNVFTGDPPAAARYIECRLTELARTQLFNDALTAFVPSYDGRKKEPVALPAKLPLLLMMGAEGIAVGLSTRMLPHNFNELIEAQIAILEKKRFKLLPDFLQGGLLDAAEYEKGAGRVRVRAVIEKLDARTLVIREIPYGTTTDSVIASIEDAARKKKIAVKAINDFTAEKIQIHVELGPDQDLDKAVQSLYAFTLCEAALASRPVVIQQGRPVEMTVDQILRYNTDRLVTLLKKELQLELKRLEDELHRKTLVQIFVENRVYKRIESCKTYPKVQEAVLTGMNAFKKLFVRPITGADVDMLLGIPIKRISQFDIAKSRKDIETIAADIAKVRKHLKALVPYAIRYLKDLIKKYGESYPRRTKVTTFDTVEVRELTATELSIGYDREKGYLGTGIDGEPLLQCSSHDKLVLVWDDGRYRVVQPPEKLFVDKNLLYCAVADRDKVMIVVYTDGQITYLKKFTFGGTIMNKDYLCTLESSKVLLFADDQPPAVYVRYKKAPRVRILQQVFHTAELVVKGVRARGIQMSSKKISAIALKKPRGWDDKADGPKGALMDF
ncbi:MAG: DNA topoisomerase IV subunit A [Kiritimatiellae bacterium]|nr:DNA topoisomerase IV subunit A [Kiritimatiellia bacterium]